MTLLIIPKKYKCLMSVIRTPVGWTVVHPHNKVLHALGPLTEQEWSVHSALEMLPRQIAVVVI